MGASILLFSQQPSIDHDPQKNNQSQLTCQQMAANRVYLSDLKANFWLPFQGTRHCFQLSSTSLHFQQQCQTAHASKVSLSVSLKKKNVMDAIVLDLYFEKYLLQSQMKLSFMVNLALGPPFATSDQQGFASCAKGQMFYRSLESQKRIDFNCSL